MLNAPIKPARPTDIFLMDNNQVFLLFQPFGCTVCTSIINDHN